MLQELLTQPKVVKHIQRGTFTIGSGGGTSTIQLENFSNENKMICLVDGYGRAGDTDSDWAVTPYITSLSLTELKIKALASGRTSGLNGFYQVIEFC